MKANIPDGYTTIVEPDGTTFLVAEESPLQSTGDPEPNALQQLAVGEPTAAMQEAQRVSDQLHEIATRIVPLLERTAKDIFEVGQELLKAKALLPHGGFENWHKEVLGMEGRTARNFMQVAKRFKTETISVLAPLDSTSLYQLASPSTPDSAIKEVLLRMEIGHTLSVKEVKGIIKDHRVQEVQEVPEEALPAAEAPEDSKPDWEEPLTLAQWQKVFARQEAILAELAQLA